MVNHRLFETIQQLLTEDELPKLNKNKAKNKKKNIAREKFSRWAMQINNTNTAEYAWNLTDMSLLTHPKDGGVDQWVYSTCGYCASGCGLFIGVKDGQAVAIKGNIDNAVNQGVVSCIKGLYQWKALHHPDRLTDPLVRKGGVLTPVSWEEALEVIATKINTTTAELGPAGVGFYSSGQLLLEESYSLAKLAKAVVGTPNIDSNLRLCTASGVQGYVHSFGSDGPPGCFADLDLAQCIFIVGCNPAEMHPAVWKRILGNRKDNGGKIIVVDPRKTISAEFADLHLQLRPGTNLALLNGLLHVLLSEKLINKEFIARHTTGFAGLEKTVAGASPEKTVEITGIKEELLIKAAWLLGQAETLVTVFVQGVFQSHLGTESALAINNLHLVTGNIGKPGAAPFSITGQCASMSHREVGGSGTLPGFRSHENKEHRLEVARCWGINPEIIPAKINDIFHILTAIEQKKVKVLWNVATNPAVSLPNLANVRKQLKEVFLIVQDIYPNETQEYADVVLPAAQWGEKTGTYTNAERRVNLGLKAVEPPGQAKSDLEIFCLAAEKLGAGHLFSWKSTEEVFAEWQGLSKGRINDMTGISYARLVREGGLQWPCAKENHGGTPRLYIENQYNHPDGKARLVGYHYAEPAEKPSKQFPFLLNTGRLPEHYHTRVKTKRIPELHLMSGNGFVEINGNDAAKLNIKNGEPVRLCSPWGKIVVEAKVCDTVLPGQLFVPFHFGDDIEGTTRAVNHLTGFTLDKFSRQPQLKISVCRVEKLTDQELLQN